MRRLRPGSSSGITGGVPLSVALACKSSHMKTERLLTLVLVAICLCAVPGCQSARSSQSSPAYSELPPQQPKLAVDEIPASDWGRGIRALHPIKVYREGSNLVVVQGL